MRTSRVPVIDKNGKHTTVHKRHSPRSSVPSRVTGILPQLSALGALADDIADEWMPDLSGAIDLQTGNPDYQPFKTSSQPNHERSTR